MVEGVEYACRNDGARCIDVHRDVQYESNFEICEVCLAAVARLATVDIGRARKEEVLA